MPSFSLSLPSGDDLRRLNQSVRRRLVSRLNPSSKSQLAALHADLAVIPEVDGMDLRHAVALVQKRAGLPITGEPDAATRQEVARRASDIRAGRDHTPHRRHGQVVDTSDTVQELLDKVAALHAQVAALVRTTGSVMLPPLDPAPDARRVVSWLPVPGTDGPKPVRVAFDGTASHYVLKRLAEDGMHDYEPETVATVLAATQLQGGGFHDVGANIGIFAIVVKALLPEAQVTAYEPGSDLAQVLRQVVALNGADISVQQIALAARDGTAEFYMSPTDTSNSLRKGFRHAVGVDTVTVARLDTWLRDHPDREPAVLKIDTESTEPDVLAGAAEFVARARPWLIVEVLKGRTEEQLEVWCEALGYHRHHITDDGPQPRTVIEGDPTYAHMNWLFTPAALPAEFSDIFHRWRGVLSDSVTLDLSH